MGLGLVHYIPLVAYFGFIIMCLASLAGKPRWALYYLIPFLPYRTMRNHFLMYPLGPHLLTILLLAVIAGALLYGKRLPPSKLYLIWLVIAIFLYCSMWVGTANGIAPAPLWISDQNFSTWKDYMLLPLVFLAAGLVADDRQSIKMIIILTAITLVFIDRSCIMESMSRSWQNFDESKRDLGPLGYGSNLTASYLAQFAMFVWGVLQFANKRAYKIVGLMVVGASFFALLYTFSREGYLAALVGIFVLGILKDRKLLPILAVFLLTWQAVVPKAVHQRVDMTQNSNGQLESSAQERVDLWKDSWNSFVHRPIIGNGYATYQFGRHEDNLRDTHNYFMKALTETGIVGLAMFLILLQQMFSLGYRLFRRGEDPLYRGLGLGIFVATCCAFVTNLFGDRWNFIEISGPMWLLIGAGVRAMDLRAPETATNVIPLQESPKSLVHK